MNLTAGKLRIPWFTDIYTVSVHDVSSADLASRRRLRVIGAALCMRVAGRLALASMQWAQGWAAYANMYAALFVMAAMCSGLITLLFRIRDRVLVWQKGSVVRW
ncbi:hypothetical protein [Paracoccus mutanolyticus]|uniref:hypothetical protein n=1 Tax=Paracoccus mutanolyticus TaxID=1499308 RepID=UPI001CB91B65|nr:hypothetical protein [Paracoccus mutanolyticus]